MSRIIIYHPLLNIVRGAERVIKSLAEYLATKNKVYIISHDDENIRIPKVQHLLVRTGSNEFNSINNLMLSKELKRIMSAIQYDILLTSNAPPIIDYFISKRKRENALHFCWCHEPRRSIFYKELGTPSNVWYGGVRTTFRTMVYKKSYLEAFKNHYDKIIVYSDFIKEIMKKMGINESKIVKVPWGINTKEIDFKPLNETRNILYVGSVDEVKNVYRLMEAMTIVTRNFANSKLIIVGPIPESERERFVKTIKKIGNGIEYHGVKIGKDLDELYKKAQVVAYPTIGEPWGLVPIEAMAQGRPVIVGTGGPRETVIDGVNGFHVNPFDTTDIAKRLVQLLSDFELCKNMGVNGRKRVEEKFDIKRTYELIDELFPS